MLTKKQFIKLLTDFKQIEEDINNVDKALKKLDPDFGGFYLSRVSTLITDALKAAMNDEYDYIGYWVYELDYGSKWKKGTITTKEGKDIKLKTAEDLYDYIIKTSK